MKLQRNINRLGKIIVLNSIINAHGFDTSIYILYCAQWRVQGLCLGGGGRELKKKLKQIFFLLTMINNTKQQ